MKRTLLIILALMPGGCEKTEAPVSGAAVHSPVRATAHLVIQINDLRNKKGQLLFCIFNSPVGFPSESNQAVASLVQPATQPTFVFDLPAGDYAAVVVHDENSNGRLDTNFFGLPNEGYGASENPKPRRRGVRFQESVFSLPRLGANIQISMQYDFL